MNNWKENWKNFDWKKVINILDGTDFTYAEDEVFVDHHTAAFPTVTITLNPTDMLKMIADVSADEDCKFYVTLKGFDGSHLDPAIEVWAGGDHYNIDLDEEDQAEIYSILDGQLKWMIGRGCEELLEEGRERMNL